MGGGGGGVKSHHLLGTAWVEVLFDNNTHWYIQCTCTKISILQKKSFWQNYNHVTVANSSYVKMKLETSKSNISGQLRQYCVNPSNAPLPSKLRINIHWLWWPYIKLFENIIWFISKTHRLYELFLKLYRKFENQQLNWKDNGMCSWFNWRLNNKIVIHILRWISYWQIMCKMD